jgi:hypothetical protein
MTLGRRKLCIETIALFVMGAVFAGACGFMCVTAYRAAQPSAAHIAAPDIAELSPALPPALISTLPVAVEPQSPPVAFAAPRPASIFGPPPSDDAPPADAPAPRIIERLMSPPILLGSQTPLPPTRPIELNVRLAALSIPLAPGRRTDFVDFGAKPASLGQYDHFTAVYDLTAHMVYLPDGERLEAHSGLGTLRDDPGHVDQKDRGATPPHIYDLTLREDLFHGVQALRLNPVGGPASIFDRAGLLAHTYMLGPGGDSNGCVSFKNYDAFLQAFQSGLVKRLAVVSNLR